MRYFIALVTIIALFNSGIIQAQEISKDTTRFGLLRKDLVLDIKKHVSELTIKDTVTGKIKYFKNNEPYGMGYKLFLSKQLLNVEYYEYKICTGCFNTDDLIINLSIVAYMYVCEDKRHKPKHSSKSRKKIFELQKKYQCSSITLEILCIK